MLLGRRSELEALNSLIDGACAGHGGALVLRGEPGIGKTALLESVTESAPPEASIASVIGVESEKELAFAALERLCSPMLERLDQIPAPQRDALATTFGIRRGAVPDPSLRSLAVLSLLSGVAEERPVVCVVDDAQWLDNASAQTLAFVASRLLAERVVLLFAVRELSDELRGLPELAVEGLSEAAASELLTAVVPWTLDEHVRQQVLAETRGNPLALTELPRGLSPAQLAGGFGVPGAVAAESRIEESFQARVQSLPRHTQRLLLAAAADATGNPALLLRTARRMGVVDSIPGPDDSELRAVLEPAESAGVLETGTRVHFRHPLMRSAIYQRASLEDRRDVHRALAEETDEQADPDRRAWHLAEASAGPDEYVAGELERCAERARARGGFAAAAAFLERAVVLTQASTLRTDRALAGAQASLEAGSFEGALDLLTAAEVGALDESRSAHADLLRGQIALHSRPGGGASSLLLAAAKRLTHIDPVRARETYLDAWGAAAFAGALATSGGLLEVSRAVRSAPPPAGGARRSDLLLDALAMHITESPAGAAPRLRQAVTAFADKEADAEESLRWGWLACLPAYVLRDEESLYRIHSSQVRAAREAGGLARLPFDLNGFATILALLGDFAGAAEAIDEADVVSEATGTLVAPFSATLLAALRGDEAVAAPLIESTIEACTAGGQGVGVEWAQWTAAILFNGLGRYQRALQAAVKASEVKPALTVPHWVLPELIEAATRAGARELCDDALEDLDLVAGAGGTDWGLGLAARSRALLSESEPAERLYKEAIERLGRTRVRPDLARARLLYGEWLRREGRRIDARKELRAAHDMLSAIGMEAFARRAEGELLATGEHLRTRGPAARDELTPQEMQIVRLARHGVPNAEIGERLFISSRTVGYHLSKALGKLGISSRRELDQVLPADDGAEPRSVVTGRASSRREASRTAPFKSR